MNNLQPIDIIENELLNESNELNEFTKCYRYDRSGNTFRLKGSHLALLNNNYADLGSDHSTISKYMSTDSDVFVEPITTINKQYGNLFDDNIFYKSRYGGPMISLNKRERWDVLDLLEENACEKHILYKHDKNSYTINYCLPILETRDSNVLKPVHAHARAHEQDYSIWKGKKYASDKNVLYKLDDHDNPVFAYTYKYWDIPDKHYMMHYSTKSISMYWACERGTYWAGDIDKQYDGLVIDCGKDCGKVSHIGTMGCPLVVKYFPGYYDVDSNEQKLFRENRYRSLSIIDRSSSPNTQDYVMTYSLFGRIDNGTKWVFIGKYNANYDSVTEVVNNVGIDIPDAITFRYFKIIPQKYSNRKAMIVNLYSNSLSNSNNIYTKNKNDNKNNIKNDMGGEQFVTYTLEIPCVRNYVKNNSYQYQSINWDKKIKNKRNRMSLKYQCKFYLNLI